MRRSYLPYKTVTCLEESLEPLEDWRDEVSVELCSAVRQEAATRPGQNSDTARPTHEHGGIRLSTEFNVETMDT